MNRREALRSLGLGATAVIIPAGVIVAASHPELDRLIECHRIASDAWCNACAATYETEKGTAAHTAATTLESRLYHEENVALGKLLIHRPASLDEVQAKLGYLTGRDGPWEASVPKEWELEALFGSLTRRAA